jgi:hypothetical protein
VRGGTWGDVSGLVDMADHARSRNLVTDLDNFFVPHVHVDATRTVGMLDHNFEPPAGLVIPLVLPVDLDHLSGHHRVDLGSLGCRNVNASVNSIRLPGGTEPSVRLAGLRISGVYRDQARPDRADDERAVRDRDLGRNGPQG